MPKMTDEILIKTEPYRSIINLLDFCYFNSEGKLGLTHGQILYALMDKDTLNKIQDEETQKEMKNFFSQFMLSKKKLFTEGEIKKSCLKLGLSENETKETLKKFSKEFEIDDLYWYQLKQVTRGCLNNDKDFYAKYLNDNLKILQDRGFITYDLKSKSRHRLYFPTLLKSHIKHVENIKLRLDSYDKENVISDTYFLHSCMRDKRFFASDIENRSYFNLFGFSYNLLKKLTRKETENLFKRLTIIDDNLRFIMSLVEEKQGFNDKDLLNLDFCWYSFKPISKKAKKRLEEIK